MGKKVLIVSYTFPPSPNVGGRRWSKLVRHLVESGNTVHVITAIPDSDGRYSTKSSDGITVHRIDSGYPRILTN